MSPTSIKIVSSSNRVEMARLFARRAARLDDAERAVVPIVDAVRKEGDKALVRFAKQWDGFRGIPAKFKVTEKQIADAAKIVGSDFRNAVRASALNIRKYCELQMPREWTRTAAPGIRLGQIVRPIDSVGCYIPGGRFPLPSTVMMTAIPAQVAGVARIAICTPRPVPEILATAAELGISEIYTVGGAQAIAALAYGTRTIRPVAKIVGPGNAYVAAAKRLVSRDVAIDFVAGPSEVLLIAERGNASWLAADMLAQAEHDPDATAILITTSRPLADAVAKEIASQFASLPKDTSAAASLRNNGAIVVVKTMDEATRLANDFAPEHLSVPPDLPLGKIQSAGSVFVGEYSPEAAGDYSSGPNHVLPTGGMPRYRGGLSVLDFVKIVSVQRLSERGLRGVAPSVVTLARSEGLEAHARSVEVRLQPKNVKRSRGKKK